MRENQFVKNHSIFELMARNGYVISDLAPAFPSLSVAEINEIFYDNRLSLRRSYERFGYLGIRPCVSKNFNVANDGSRSNGKAEIRSHDSYRVHCYGGSTTVGDGVADSQTISAYLETELNLRNSGKVAVFNYGAGNHTSLHSSLRLLDHCLSGNVPDYAVFLNGYNDCFYSAGGADGIATFLDEVLEFSQDSEFRHSTLFDLVNLIPNSFNHHSLRREPNFSDVFIAHCFENIKKRYKGAVAIQKFAESEFGVRIKRFIEPNKILNCRDDQDLLPRLDVPHSQRNLAFKLYLEIDRNGVREVFGKDVISLLKIDQEQQSFPLYLDGVHFTPEMNKWIATHISKMIKIKKRKKSQILFGSEPTNTSKSELTNPDNYPLY
jgi:hypothetical protein